MQAIIQSFLLVFASEMGDKTQLLALVLATRFRKPWTIMAGILAATLINHGLASWAGGWIAEQFPPIYVKWTLALIFFGFAAWILIPDKEEDLSEAYPYGAFLTTVIAFFLAEMGDKTQLATIALGARFTDPFTVTCGTTLGMLAADGLVVFFGERLTNCVPMKYIRWFACGLFALFGCFVLLH